MEGPQSEGRCNCKSDNSWLPTTHFGLPDQLSFAPAIQDPSLSPPAPFPTTPIGRGEVPELTRDVLYQDFIMVSYFSGTRHLSLGLLSWMKLYVRLQSWNLGNEDALTPDDLAVVENAGLIPILPPLREKPTSKCTSHTHSLSSSLPQRPYQAAINESRDLASPQDELAPRPGSIDQPFNYTRPAAKEAPVSKLTTAEHQQIPETAVTHTATTVASTTITSYTALLPSPVSMEPEKEMALCSLMSRANITSCTQKAASAESESEPAFAAESKPDPATMLAPVPTDAQNQKSATVDQTCRLIKEEIGNVVDASIHRLCAAKPVTAELAPTTESKHESTIEPAPVPASAQILKIAPIDEKKKLSMKEMSEVGVTIIPEFHNRIRMPTIVETKPKPAAEPVSIPESTQKLQSAPIDENRDLPKKETALSVTEVLFKLHAQKSVTAEPVLSAKTKPEPTTATKQAPVLESPQKLEPGPIDTKWKTSNEEMNKVVEISVPEFLHRLHAYKPVKAKPTTKAETKPPIKGDAPVLVRALKIKPSPRNTIQKLSKKEMNKDEKSSASEFIYRFSAYMAVTAKPATKVETKPESTTERAPVSESALNIEPTPIDTKQLSKEQMNKEEKISASEFIYRLSMSVKANPATNGETNPEAATEKVPQNAQKLQIAPIYEKTKKKLSKEDVSEIFAMSMPGSNKPAASEIKPEPESGHAPVPEDMQKLEPVPIEKNKKPSKKKRIIKASFKPEIQAASVSETYPKQFERVRDTYNDYFNFLEQELYRKNSDQLGLLGELDPRSLSSFKAAERYSRRTAKVEI